MNKEEEKREDRKKYAKQYRIKNKDKRLEYEKQYRIKNRETLNEKNKQYYQDNKEKIIDKNIKWIKNNPEKTKAIKSRYQNKKYKIDLKFKLNNRMSNAIGETLKGNKNNRHWETLVGYKLDDLIKRLKKTIPRGCMWQDYIDGKLHIDHIIPISVFNFTKPEHPDFKRCWALENLRLLPAEENLRKNAKLTKPFQPALKI